MTNPWGLSLLRQPPARSSGGNPRTGRIKKTTPACVARRARHAVRMDADSLAGLLLRPPVAAGLESLPANWRRARLHILCAVPPGLEEGPWLPGALRGAFEALFRPRTRLTPGRTIPKPFAIAAEVRGRTLTVELSLFGYADFWRESAFDALIAALEAGVAIRPERGWPRMPLPVLEAAWTRSETLDLRTLGAWARLSFRTRLGPQRALGLRAPDMVFALAERVAGLARWQGLGLEVAWGDWRRTAEALRYDCEAMHPVAWFRRSGAQRGRVIPMAGLMGHLDIHRPPEALEILLSLGETCFVGGHTTLGLGRYVLS